MGSGGFLTKAPEGTFIDIWAKPRASKSALAEEREEALTIRLAAPPVDGKANEALLKFLSKLLKIPKSELVLANGASSRKKRVLVQGLSPEEVSAKLGY